MYKSTRELLQASSTTSPTQQDNSQASVWMVIVLGQPEFKAIHVCTATNCTHIDTIYCVGFHMSRHLCFFSRTHLLISITIEYSRAFGQGAMAFFTNLARCIRSVSHEPKARAYIPSPKNLNDHSARKCNCSIGDHCS